VQDLFARAGIPEAIVSGLELATLGRLLLASVLGGVVGLERQLAGKAAGLRTNLLICVGAALITEVSVFLPTLAGTGDPGRMAAQVVSGIGFIGAGTILQSRGRVIGLTSAATLWVVAALGIAVGARAYVQAIGTTLLVMGTLLLLRRFEEVIARRHVDRRYTVSMEPRVKVMDELHDSLCALGLRVRVDGVDKKDGRFQLTLRMTGSGELHQNAMRLLAADERVTSVARQ